VKAGIHMLPAHRQTRLKQKRDNLRVHLRVKIHLGAPLVAIAMFKLSMCQQGILQALSCAHPPDCSIVYLLSGRSVTYSCIVAVSHSTVSYSSHPQQNSSHLLTSLRLASPERITGLLTIVTPVLGHMHHMNEQVYNAMTLSMQRRPCQKK
jgi:hypothetical protein